jgi:uncharacterized membrane protein YczE
MGYNYGDKMEKIFNRKNIIDVLFYITGILFDSFSVFIIVQAGLGASPFGALASNMLLVIPITIGMASIIYEFINMVVASLLAKEKMQFQNLIYGFIFAFFLELWYFLIPSFAGLHIIFSILIFIFGVCMSDFSKSILNLTKFPKLTTVVTTYAISKRFKVNLNIASKIRNLFVVILAFIFAVISGNPLANLGLGTIASFIAFGYFLKLVDPKVKKYYNSLIFKNQNKNQDEANVEVVIDTNAETETEISTETNTEIIAEIETETNTEIETETDLNKNVVKQ